MAIPPVSLSFARKKCLPCEGGTKPLPKAAVRKYLKTLKGWSLVRGGLAIVREYRMQDFIAAVDLIRRMASLAEKEGHHPDLYLTHYRKLKIELTTHAIGGLSENDFIVAAKIDRLPKKLVF